ncbi:uncharacterized protein LOC143213938 isoform X2 [Lasioglossum baleicum]|uniref:uncharacterized protein LOC143213938 isoform X2 n=1 Tax=Lasioglossum baleicum TaxID=434251 RepID=UPI003FCE27A3
MEDDAFRDYCKAENSDDEEANRDLQSHLYSKIYYASNDVENVDTKPSIKFEPPNTGNEGFCNKVDSSRTFSDNARKDVTRNYENNYITTDPVLAEEDNKSNVKSICSGNQTEVSDKDSKSNSNVFHTLKHLQENVISQGGKGSVSQRVEVIDRSISSNTSRDVSIKPEAEEGEVELETTNSNFEINESATGSHLKSSVDDTGENIQEEELSFVRHDVHHDNILNRYEFSKLFINELYQQKYEQLQLELQKWKEEKEMNLKEKECEEGIKEKKEEITSNIRTNSTSETETDSKYNVYTKNDKQWKASDFFEDEIMLSSDTETDSEQSIFEVPIPPKPQPPVINLQDSDDSDALSNNDDSDECSFIVEDEINKKVSHTSLRKTNSSKDRLIYNITEDIVLNCSEVQKGASSITEIKEMSKTVQNKSGECHDKNKNDSEEKKSASMSKTCNKNLNETRKSLSSSEKDNVPEFRVPAVPSCSSNVVFDRDKDKLVTSMEDVTNLEISHQPSSSRKRHRENDNECSVNAKQKKQSYSKDTPSEVYTDQHGDKDKTETVWRDYFFRPMSEKIKAFYNESREDPRLWAILDEDLMPNFARRKRFWNVKCNNCNDVGHQTYHCTLPRKPPRCYMCGTQGHTETRCPQKMCLTCGKKQGTFRKTCEFCRTLYCDMCRAIGHKSTECPDHWRRFHQTTQNSEIHVPENLSEVMKPADLLYCCNCTRRGHDSSTCHDYRWSQHFPTPAFVTNYMEGNEERRNSASEDVIPLSDPKTKKEKTKNIIIPEGLGDVQYSSILYRYGSFKTSAPNGQIGHKELDGDLYFKTDNFLKDEFPPIFLHELIKIVPFDLVIYRTKNKALFIRIRSFTGHVGYIQEIFIYWLKLTDEDKRLLKVHVNIPRDVEKLLHVFYMKWEEMLKTADNPHTLSNEIKTLKSTLTSITDPSILHTTTDRILRLRSKLLNIYNIKVSRWPETLRQITKRVKKSLRKKPKTFVFTDKVYLRCIHIYNEIYLPRTLTDKEMKVLFIKYKQQPMPRSKKQRKKLDPYALFLQSYNLNMTPLKQKKTGKQNPKNSSTTSPNIIREQSGKILPCAPTASITQEQNKRLPACTTTGNAIQEQSKMIATCTSTENVSQEQIKRTSVCTSNKNDIQEHSNIIPIWVSNENVTQEQNKKVPICTSTETISATSNVQRNDNVTRTNTGVPTGRCHVGDSSNTVSESKATYPIETVQLQCNNDTSTNDKVENTTNQIQERIWQPNLINTPIVGTISHQSGNNQIKHTSCTLIQSNDNNSEENRETVKNNNAPATSSLQQEHTDIPETPVTKKRKKKKKKNSESNTEVAKNVGVSTDVAIESKAKKVINEALEFNLPYMNKAVEEVKKRINDKNIKQEHIDVLQRLINLERDHQQYVSSFCSYLQ